MSAHMSRQARGALEINQLYFSRKDEKWKVLRSINWKLRM